jgi:alpha-tubulin suppressor-like RCC1 family protein
LFRDSFSRTTALPAADGILLQVRFQVLSFLLDRGYTMHFEIVFETDRKAIAQAVFLLAGLSLAGAYVAGPAWAGPTSTELTTIMPNPSVFGQEVTFTSTVQGGGPTGTVTFEDGSTTLGSGPVSLLEAKSNLALGEHFSCTLSNARGVKCWGQNFFGQLGNGNNPTDSPVPVDVIGLTTGVSAVAAGHFHACAVTSAGGVKCWGDNNRGQLGDDNRPNDASTPVDVVGLASGVAAIAGGGEHTCALTDAGGVKCWGYNHRGQLGDGNLGINSDTPVDVVGMASGIAAIAGGLHHTCALTQAGGVKCWGWNTNGQLGDNNPGTNSDIPVDVVGLASGVAAITGGRSHACALTEAGGVKCWGWNIFGQLGDGNSGTDSNIPTDVTGLDSGVAAITAGAGASHTCALLDTGAVKCWGYNLHGELGDNNAGTDSDVPVDVVGLSAGGYAIATGTFHTCATTEAGAVKCWGFNPFGQVGDDTMVDKDIPTDVTGLGNGSAYIPAGAEFSTDAFETGSHSITATYDGDAFNATSTSSAVTHVVNKGGTEISKIKVKPKKPKAGRTIRLKVMVEAVSPAVGTPEGKAVVKDGRKKLGKFKVKKGKAKIKIRKAKAGKHKIKVKYKGHANWHVSKAKAKIKVR